MKLSWPTMRVVFDMDGTLADNSHREHLARRAAGSFGSKTEKSQAWEDFHAGIPDDKPIDSVAQTLLALHAAGHTIEIWTARPEKYRYATMLWLQRFQLPYHALRMRADGDWRKSYEVKLGWLEQWTVHLLFEDHPETTKLFRERGVVVAQVGEQTQF